MATPQEILTQEAILRDLRQKDASAQAAERAVASVMVDLEAAMARARQAQAAVISQRVAAGEALAAAGNLQSALDGYGGYSVIDQLLRSERFAGKSASVDFIKANPTCTEAEALDAWKAAGMAATGLPKLLQDHALLAVLYRGNLAKAGLTPDSSWESQRAWIVATDKAVIMGA